VLGKAVGSVVALAGDAGREFVDPVRNGERERDGLASEVLADVAELAERIAEGGAIENGCTL
jgi:hypothetical protein